MTKELKLDKAYLFVYKDILAVGILQDHKIKGLNLIVTWHYGIGLGKLNFTEARLSESIILEPFTTIGNPELKYPEYFVW